MTVSIRNRRGANRLFVVASLVLALGGVTPAAPSLAATTPSPSTTTGLPTPADAIDPVTTIGGPKLASTGITTDLPPGTPAPPVMHDVAWLVADLDTGEVIAAKAPHAKLAPASTLKTLASLVLLPKIDPRKSYSAQDSDTRADGTRIGLVPGQLYTGRQLFEALLMGSANDAAYMLSRINGGIPATLAEMNDEAHRLGALDTHAGNPSGLDAPGQSSSAYDLALFARAAMQIDAFRTYDTTLTVPFPGNPVPGSTKTTGSTSGTSTSSTSKAPVIVDAAGIKRQTYALSNHNTLLFNYPGTIGGKDGFTDQAHRTYISVARRGGHTYVVTEMGGTDYMQWRPTAKLLDWAFANGAKARPIGTLVNPGEVEAAAASSSAAAASRSAATPTQSRAAQPAVSAASGVAALGLTDAGSVRGLATLSIGGAALLAALLLGSMGATRARRRNAYVARRARRPARMPGRTD
ncbi:MAG: hypothetical protein ABI131_10035 [Nostocoides sp.]